MAIENEHEHGRYWATARGRTLDLQRLLRAATNRDVAALAALVRTIQERHPALWASSKATDAYATLRTLPPGVVSRLLRHSSGSFWVATTAYLVRRLAGVESTSRDLAFEGDVHANLEAHLADLSRIALTGRLLALDSFEVTLVHLHATPFLLPTTGIAIDGLVPGQSLSVECSPVDRAAVRVRVNQGERRLAFTTDQPWAMLPEGRFHEVEAHGLRLLPLPRVNGSAPGFEVDRWDPYLLNGWVRHEAFPGQIPALLDDASNLRVWGARLEEAMGILGRCWPEMEAEIATLVNSVVPVKSPNADLNLSVSAPEFPGALICSLDPAPAMGEVLVHEYRHNLLNILNSFVPLFGDDSPRESRFYSPWRDDLRPLHGILHALFTFAGVVDFYRRFLEHESSSSRNARAARRRVKGHSMRLQLGLRQLSSFARLTPFAAGLVEGLTVVIEAHGRHAATLNGPDVEDVVGRVRAHAAQAGVATDGVC